MGRIDPMYQFALDSYILLFVQSIDKSPKSTHLPDRIALLNDYHTFAVYKFVTVYDSNFVVPSFMNKKGINFFFILNRNTCRALFEQHKLLFSFHMCIKILEAQGKIVSAEYNFLLKGGVVLDRENQMDNPCRKYINFS